ncbi:tyrosine-protein kinase, partial [Klebsiella pneumoniae]|nr:tyrosine-protein kinase [Klebsiella pneumoniae]
MKDTKRSVIQFGGDEINGKVGELIEKDGIPLKIDEINAKPGAECTIKYVSKLKAIADLQENLSVADQCKDTGILILSYLGDDPLIIKNIVDSISEN